MSAASRLLTPQAADLARGFQRLHPFHRLGERDGPAPVQKIQVEPVRPQPFEAGVAGPLQPAASGVLRIHLADQEDLLAQPRKRLAEEALGGAVAVHLGGVDQGHAKVDAGQQRLCFRLATFQGVTHPPSSLTD